MDIAIENVTPTKAATWLNTNKSNRKLRDGLVEKYAEDMRKGRWTTCPTPISFYDDGDVADGQHRLWAIVESGCAQRFPVARNLHRDDGLNIDTGLGRSLVDNARISRADNDLTNELVAVCRSIADGVHAGTAGGSRRSNAEKLALCEAHKEAGQWACTNGPRGKMLRNAIVMAAMARAWYLEPDKERLRRFADVLSTGLYDGDGETAAIALRNYILTKTAINSSGLWRDTFLKAQNAIHYFMRSKRLTVLKTVAEEAYPLKQKRSRA
jgi:hypothetical protein